MNWFEVIIFSLQLILVGCVFLYKKSLEEFAKVLYARELDTKKRRVSMMLLTIRCRQF